MNNERKEILEHLKEYLQSKIERGETKIFYNELDHDEKIVDCINAIDNSIKEIERLNNKIHDVTEMLNETYNHRTKLRNENQRLNNIINTFEEEIEVELTFEDKDCLLEHNTFITIHDTLEKVLKRIKELKEGK